MVRLALSDGSRSRASLPSNRVRILVATTPVDFRKGHGGLAAMVQSVLRKDPFTGTVFVFRDEPLCAIGSRTMAKRLDRLKLLYWDGAGLVLAYTRLEDTTFTWPAIKDGMMTLNHAQFEALFSGLAPLLAMQASPAGQRASRQGT